MAGPLPDDLPWPDLPAERFPVISLDPPWHFATRGRPPHGDRNAQRHYPTASIEHLKTLPLRQIAAPDSHVFLWITSPFLVEGVHLDLFRAWGVEPASLAFVWIKLWNNIDMDQYRRTPLLDQDLALGMGYTTRQNAELCILGRIGSPQRARADIRQVIVSPRREHSRKPEEYFAGSSIMPRARASICLPAPIAGAGRAGAGGIATVKASALPGRRHER